MQLTSEYSVNRQETRAMVAARQYLISSVGAVAEQQLNGIHVGQILAAFDRSFYITTSTGLFCVGLSEIGRGPLNALLAKHHKHLPFKVDAGEHVSISEQRIILSHSRIVNATQAQSFHCEISFEKPTQHRVERNRQILRTLSGMPDDGFYWLLDGRTPRPHESSIQTALRRSTSESLTRLASYLRAGFVQKYSNVNSLHASAVLPLLGAGPGLTPASDDVIAGVMLALIRFQRADLAWSIWQTISPCLATRTNRISAAHLEQAALGFCGESMNKLLDDIFQAENIEVATLATELDRMGCTSGWDTLGGVIIVIDAWQFSLKTTHRNVTTC